MGAINYEDKHQKHRNDGILGEKKTQYSTYEAIKLVVRDKETLQKVDELEIHSAKPNTSIRPGLCTG